MLSCIVCEQKLDGKKTKFCSLTCKNSFTNNKFQNYETQQKRGRERKMKLIQMKGGKCEICSYDKNYAVLCFHHISPKDKELPLTIRECSNNTWDTLVKEVQKCKLLCHNCHMELHFPDYNNT
jgi:hypothetical protein